MTIVPKRWYSWDFDVVDGERHLAVVDVSSWREKGLLTVEGVEHRVYREGAMSDFILERGGTVLARGTKPSAFRDTILVGYSGRQYMLRKKSVWRRAFILLDGDNEIGSLAPDSIWTRHATVSLPRDWPLPINVFVIWLAIILWKREADAGAVAASV